jgi:hypothetical protein
MTFLELKPALLALLLPVVEKSQHDWPILRQVLLTLSALGRHDEALTLLETHKPGPLAENDGQAVYAYLYSSAGRAKDAAAARDAYVFAAPPYFAPAKQPWFTIGVINPARGSEDLIKSAQSQHFNANFPAQMLSKLGSRYSFASILFGAGPSVVDAFLKARPVVIINNIVNAESLLSGSNLFAVEQLAQSINLPIINHPRHASTCTRQMNFAKFAALKDVVTPRLKRFARDVTRLGELVPMIEQSFTYPMIVRTVSDHDAKNMVKVDSPSMLRDTLLRFSQREVYVIQYLDTKHRGEYCRKMRAAFVEGLPTIVRADYDLDWVVQGRKRESRQKFYRDHLDLLADANDIVARPSERLGAAAMAALESIGKLLPLDIFGIDFDVDEHGKIVFYEANACMNLFSNAPVEFSYPPEADATVFERMEHLMQRKANRGGAASAPASAH